MLKVSALEKKYPSTVALDSLSFEVGPGVVGVVGANGAGKSTLMKILLGLVQPTGGSLSVLGHDPMTEGLKVRQIIGYMPEHDCLPTDVSATQFIVHMARVSGLPPKHARERAAETLRHVGLFEEQFRRIGGYSTGMKQRVKLAQALVHDPRLLILDEPTNGLDPKGRDEMLSLIERTGETFGVSVLMSSHLLNEIAAVCTSLVVLEHGRLLHSGDVAEFTGLSRTINVVVDSDPKRLMDRLQSLGMDATLVGKSVRLLIPPDIDAVRINRTVIEAVAELGLPLVRIEQQRQSLNEIFTGHLSSDAQEVSQPTVENVR